MDGVAEQRRLRAVFDTEDFLVLVHDVAGAGQEQPTCVHVLPRTAGMASFFAGRPGLGLGSRADMGTWRHGHRTGNA